MNATPSRSGRRRYLPAAAAAVLAALLGIAGAPAPLDDAFHGRFPASSGAPSPVAVIGIDAGDPWPWRDGRIAALLERVRAAGARGIALDLPLDAHAGSDPGGTARLARILLDERLVLGVALSAPGDAAPRAQLPAAEFAGSARLGHLLLPHDRDGRVRRHLPYVVDADGIGWPSLALALARPGQGQVVPERRSGTWRIPYAAAPPVLPATGVESGSVGARQLGGRWVLVGITDPAHAAPVPGPHGTPALFPVQHQARALAAVLAGSVARPLSWPAQALLALILAGSAAFAGSACGGRGWRMPLALLAGLAATVLVSAVLLKKGIWFAPGGPLAVLGGLLLAWCVQALRQRLRLRHRLPGLATRHRLLAALEAARAARAPHALLLVEAAAAPDATAPPGDHDSGRLAGLLRTRARRPGDVAAYLGAGRFALLLPGTSAAAAERILEEIHRAAGNGGPPLHGQVHACGDAGCDCLQRLARRAAPPGPGMS